MCTNLLNSNELIAQIFLTEHYECIRIQCLQKALWMWSFRENVPSLFQQDSLFLRNMFFLVVLKTEICVHSCYPVNYFEGRHIAYLSFH